MVATGVGRAETLRIDVAWDPIIGSFVRTTCGPAGRILSRIDLDPSEKRAAMRCLVAKRTTHDERLAACRALEALGLIVVTTDGAARQTDVKAAVNELSVRFQQARRSANVVAFAKFFDMAVTELLTLAWALNFAVAERGYPLPRLEDVDPDLPFVPPLGADRAARDFDAEAALATADLDFEKQGQAFQP
jgi:hypothetical protein